MIPFDAPSNSTTFTFPNGKLPMPRLPCPTRSSRVFVISSERVRGTADVFYLRPLTGQSVESALWFSDEALSPSIIDQMLNRLKLLADFYTETRPVETGPTLLASPSNTTTATTTASANMN